MLKKASKIQIKTEFIAVFFIVFILIIVMSFLGGMFFGREMYIEKNKGKVVKTLDVNECFVKKKWKGGDDNCKIM